ncbi:hypothetical protein B0T16DRAFT_131179 [Cercophora newfieldiana]|uniref:VanZ-like domain-containing protein n=1 Tax=Cercophora newfieldiana TaxID=92897 RepID=A0AA39YDF3_9PEZI|nr:hypothetical protein B0T16DRAFT_131179 [Cercophora newfieldiana]
MRIRLPFAGIFAALLLLAAYIGLTDVQPSLLINDKVLHLLTFFLLTLAFYWILDTNRRRTLNFTLVVCTLGLGVGSEFLQAILPNGRLFDIYDVVANVVGSLAAIGLCSLYHKRMLERKRSRRGYGAVPGEDVGDEEDLELGESVGVGSSTVAGDHEEGVVASASPDVTRSQTLEEEVDNWDEHADDPWEEDDMGDIGVAGTSSKDARGDQKAD